MRSFILRSGLLAALLCLIPALAWADNGQSVPQYLQKKVKVVCGEAAAKGLIKPVDKVDCDTLLALVKAPCDQVRYVAVYTLGDIHECRAVEPLIALLDDPDPTARRIAAHALGKINDPRAVYPLAYMLNNPNERVMVRCAAASAIGRISGDRASRILLASYPRSDGRVHNVIGIMLSSR